MAQDLASVRHCVSAKNVEQCGGGGQFCMRGPDVRIWSKKCFVGLRDSAGCQFCMQGPDVRIFCRIEGFCRMQNVAKKLEHWDAGFVRYDSYIT